MAELFLFSGELLLHVLKVPLIVPCQPLCIDLQVLIFVGFVRVKIPEVLNSFGLRAEPLPLSSSSPVSNTRTCSASRFSDSSTWYLRRTSLPHSDSVPGWLARAKALRR